MKNVATHLAVLAIGAGVGIGAVAVAQDSGQPTAKSSASTAEVLKQLKLVNKNLGGYANTTPFGGSIHELLKDIRRNTR